MLHPISNVSIDAKPPIDELKILGYAELTAAWTSDEAFELSGLNAGARIAADGTRCIHRNMSILNISQHVDCESKSKVGNDIGGIESGGRCYARLFRSIRSAALILGRASWRS